MDAETEAARRSFTSTGFLSFLASWAGSLVTMLTAADPVVRHWGAAGMVCLPALYLVCSTLIKRMKLKAQATMAASTPRPAPRLVKPAAAPPDPGAP